MKISKGSPFSVLGLSAAVVGTTALVGGVTYLALRQAHRQTTPTNLVYVASGYGGYRTPSKPVTATAGRGGKAQPKGAVPTPDPLRPALDAYEKGRFAEAESSAQTVRVAAQAKPHADIPARRSAVKALHLMAFVAARRHDLKTAQKRFAQVRVEAATLPDHGRPVEKPAIGAEPEPTFEENAAYQHAVCTAALGDKAGAEAEYVAFMRQYPESPLLAAAVKRVSWLHGGNIPKPAELVWEQAMRTAQAREKTRTRDASLCGPECLAELLRRQGKSISAAALASEMGTSDQGTTVLGLEKTARRHGYPMATGVALTDKGLREQALPLIARVEPSHYVVVEAILPTTDARRSGDDTDDIQVWDPDAKGIGKGAERRVPATVWKRAWHGGIAVTLGRELASLSRVATTGNDRR